MNDEKYPKEYRDDLNRINYVIHNEYEKTLYTFYGKTNKIKIKYVYYRKNVYFDAFSKTGEVIFSNFTDNFLDCKVEKKHDGTISFLVHPKKILHINQLK